MAIKEFSITVLLALSLAGCSSTPISNQEMSDEYGKAMSLVRVGQYDAAIKRFEVLKDSMDDPTHRGRAEMGHLYALYKKDDYDKVIEYSARIIKQYPVHSELVYAVYLRAMSYQQQGNQELLLVLDQMSPSGEYPVALRKAYAEFTILIKRFPDSNYARDAHSSLQSIRKQLARFELHAAQFYMVQGDYEEVLRRARYINEYYANLGVRKQALALMEKAYAAMEKSGKAKRIARELEELEASSN